MHNRDVTVALLSGSQFHFQPFTLDDMHCVACDSCKMIMPYLEWGHVRFCTKAFQAPELLVRPSRIGQMDL